jgi:inward rectifier potassium channel
MSSDSPPPTDDRDRDLGFGTVVANASHWRMLNRDGSFNAVRRGLGWRHLVNLYYSLLAMTWPRFFLLTTAAFLATNALFALAYLGLGSAALEGAFADQPFRQAFFFSVHTLSTLGYGSIVPASTGANVVVTLEVLTGVFGLALVAGIVFARFSRPMARIAFSRNAVVAPYEGMTAMMFRIANLRRSQIIELRAKVMLSRFEVDAEGERHRRFYDLPLERRKVMFFPLSWTIVHPIDEDSPLSGFDEDRCGESEAEFMVLLSGIDEAFSQTVHARSSYVSQEVVWNARFRRILELPQDSHEPISVDVSRIDEIERL